MRASPVSRKGLTLIEVIVALMILSIGVTALMGAMTRCLSTVRTARNREVARALLRQVDIEYPIATKDMDEMSEEGDFEDRPGYVWFRDILIVDEEERPGLFLVTTRVQWSERGRAAFEESTIYRYAPDAESIASEVQAN
jgi:prepilin-type N-terminal cleavage/methylation domain-containing protein